MGVALGAVSAGAASPTVPTAPKTVSAKATGNRSIAVSFTKPASDGGSPILGYHAVCTSTNGGVTGSHSANRSPVVVPSLTAGKTYTCKVTARNKVGEGPASAASGSAVARPTPPPAPKVTAVAPTGLRAIRVTFTKPASDGGSAISRYLATCTSSNGGAKRTQQGPKSPLRVAGLTAADTYTCTVAAGNSIGIGPSSAPSSKVIPLPTAPGAPKITSAKASGLRSVTLTVTPPANTGGAPITNYSVQCTSSNGGAKRSTVAPRSPIRVNGLSDGKTYTCTVAATNGVRYGPASAPSAAVVARSH